MSETEKQLKPIPPGLEKLNAQGIFYDLVCPCDYCHKEECETLLEYLTYTEIYEGVPHIVVFCPGCGEISDHRVILQSVEQHKTCATCYHGEFEPGDESVGIWAGYYCAEDHNPSQAWETYDICQHWRGKYTER